MMQHEEYLRVQPPRKIRERAEHLSCDVEGRSDRAAKCSEVKSFVAGASTCGPLGGDAKEGAPQQFSKSIFGPSAVQEDMVRFLQEQRRPTDDRDGNQCDPTGFKQACSLTYEKAHVLVGQMLQDLEARQEVDTRVLQRSDVLHPAKVLDRAGEKWIVSGDGNVWTGRLQAIEEIPRTATEIENCTSLGEQRGGIGNRTSKTSSVGIPSDWVRGVERHQLVGDLSHRATQISHAMQTRTKLAVMAMTVFMVPLEKGDVRGSPAASSEAAPLLVARRKSTASIRLVNNYLPRVGISSTSH